MSETNPETDEQFRGRRKNGRMSDIKEISNRIESIRDTRKITNAMYLISSTKLRKARKSLEDTNPFFRSMRREIGTIIRKTNIRGSRYFLHEEKLPNEKEPCGFLVLTADKGLAGAYNQNIIKETLNQMEKHPDHRLFVMGEYGRHYFSSHGIPYDTEFMYSDHEPSLYMARKVAGYIMDLFDRGELSRIYIIYTTLKNALASEVSCFRLLPFDKSHFTDDPQQELDDTEYEYIPSPMEVLENCIPVYSIGVVYSVLVYAFCCEQNDRMMAMDAANQNADELMGELQLKYNRLRQNSITQEITEISASVKGTRK